MPLEKVPGLQKRINRMARLSGKPVVVATQMLESMISAPVPTRAEVSDVATAVFEGADAVMLSAESAAGSYPVKAVATMNRIAEEVERDAYYRSIINAQRAPPEATNADAIAIAVAARNFAETLDLKAIVAWTSSGATAFRIARERPEAPVLALTPNRETACRLALVWGVHAVVTKDAYDVDDMARRAVLTPRRGIRVENEIGALDELDRPVLEGANTRFGTLEIEKNANRASAFFLERPDHSYLSAHLLMRGMAHINAKEIGAGMK
jgi:pyruvate kinase